MTSIVTQLNIQGVILKTISAWIAKNNAVCAHDKVGKSIDSPFMTQDQSLTRTCHELMSQ